MPYRIRVNENDPDTVHIYDKEEGHRIAYIQRYSNLPTELTLCPRYWEEEATVNLIEFLKCLQLIGIKGINLGVI